MASAPAPTVSISLRRVFNSLPRGCASEMPELPNGRR